MSIKDSLKKLTNSLADEKREKTKKQQQEQLAKKAFSSNSDSGSNRDTGKHSNSVTPTKKQAATALKNAAASTGVTKGNSEKGVNATKVQADKFTGTSKTTNQNRYEALKQGAGLISDSDGGFERIKAGSVRMSDSQKGNNNAKPTGALDIIKMANIQSKHLDRTVQATINAHNASVMRDKPSGSSGRSHGGIGGSFIDNANSTNNNPPATFSSFAKFAAADANKKIRDSSPLLSNLPTIKKTKEEFNKGNEEKAATIRENRSKGIGSVEPGGKIHDAWEETKRSTAQRDPITVKAVNGKAPKGLYPGDKVVTNAGTYTIKGIASDGSYITDSTEYYKDSSGKLWEKASDTTQTTYNTYSYDDPNAKRETTYKKQGVIEHVGDTISHALSNDKRAKEYKQNQASKYTEVEQEFLNDKESNKYTGKNQGLLALMGKGTESEWTPKMGLLSTATQMQKDMYNYTYAKHGKKAANEYLESLEYSKLNPKNTQSVEKMIETDAKTNPVAASAASVGANLIVPQIAAVRNAVQSVKNATHIGKYKPVDMNDSLNAISGYGTKVRSKVSESIENPALRLGYNAAMSIADMAAQTALLGGLGKGASKLITLSMSTVSANDSVIDTLSRGGSQQQAFINGFSNGVLEYISESPAVEGLFSVGRGIRPIKDVKSFATSLLRQMGTEGFGEGFANITQNLADQIIMGDKSNFGLSVKQYEGQGMSHSEAVKQASMDMYVKSTAEAMATGALAGGVMGGAATGFNTVQTGRNINSNTAYAKDLAQTAEDIGLEGNYAETAKELSKGNRVSATDAANLKGAIQDYYQKETQNDIARFYNYVGLEAPHRLATTFAKVSSRDETGFRNKKFTDAWLDKSTDVLMKINQYRATPTADLRTDIKEYLEYSNALLYSGALSEEGQFSAAVRAQANQVINGIPASAAGKKIVTNDSSLYDENTNENDNATAQSTENTDADTAAESAAPKSVDAEIVAQGTQENNEPVVDITDDIVPSSESPAGTAENAASVQNVTESEPVAVSDTAAESTPKTTTQSESTLTPQTTATTSVKTENKKAENKPKKETGTVSGYKVGQKKGSTVSYHKSAEAVNNSEMVENAVKAMGNNFDYDIVRESPKSNTVLFIKVNDFNKYAEPTIESEIDVTLNKDGSIKSKRENKYAAGLIIPDKSEYVPLDYKGFDMQAQKARENSWKNALDEKGEHRKYDSSKLSKPDYFYEMFGDLIRPGELSEDIVSEQKDKKEDGAIPETDKKSSEKGTSNFQKVSVDDQNAKNYSENETKNEETQISETEPQPSFEDEYEIIEWDDFITDADDDTSELETKKIDMDKLRSNRAIAKDMKEAFDLLYDTPKSANQMGQIVKEVYEQVVEDGYYDLSSAADLFANQIENNRYIGEVLRTEEEKEFYQAVTHGNFKVDDIVKKEIVDYGDWQKANKNIMLKSSPNGTQSIDNFYSSMESEYPEVFHTSAKITGDATTEGEMLVEMVAAAREIQDKMYTREGDVGTAFEGLDTEDISLIWAVKLGDVLSIAKADKKKRATKPKAEVNEDESEDKKKPVGKSKKSASADEGSGEGKSKSEEGDGSKAAEGHNESSDAEEKVSESEPKIPTELKARGGRKSKQQSEPNKDNPLRGSLNDLQASKNYGKTDAAIKSIKAENRAVAENIGSIIKEIGKKMRVNIYSKRYRNKGNALGWFDTMHSQIHAQEQEQLGVVIHELGHKLDQDYNLHELAGLQEMLDSIPNLKERLKKRGYTEYEMQFETTADFVWKYLSEPDVAYEMGTYAKGRNFYDTFELALDKKTLKHLKSIRADVLAFTTKSTAERMRGQVRTREEVRTEDRIHIHDLKTPNRVYGKMIKGFDKAYGNFQENFIDSTWAASKVVKDIEKASGRKLTPKENLQLALEFSGSNASVTDTLITRGFITPDGEITGRESLGQIIKETEKLAAKAGRTSKQNAFDDYALYLVALHAIDRERMGQTTMSEDATGGDNVAAYEQLVRDMDRKYGDVLKNQAEKIYDWYDAFMRSWMVDTGMLQQDKYDLMRRMYPHYVPMFRVMDMRHSNGQVSKGVNPLKYNSLKGSTREIYNPLENMMIQVNNIVKAYHNNEVALTIHRLWTNRDKSVRDTIGQFVTQVQEPLQKQEVNTVKQKDKLQEAIFHRIYSDVWSASDRGNFSRLGVEEQSKVIDEMTNKDLIDDAIEDIMVDFVPSDRKLNDKTVVALLPDGEKVYYEIQDEHLAKAITAVQPSIEVLQHIGKLTRVFSALTTSQNPIFAISNAIRDFQHGWVYIDADKWYQNFTYPAEWAIALAQSLKNEFGGKHQSDMYKQYKSTTGFDSKFMSDADTLGDVMSQMRRARNPLIWATRFIERLNGAVESATRYVAYKRKLAVTGDVMTAGKAARDATVNSNRKGTATKQAGQLVPFLGAAVAGVNQFAELVTQPVKNKGKLARAMVTQAIPAILLAFMNAGWFGDDDEKRKEYDEMSEYTKNNYWVFKWGDTWLKLPRDREISAVFGTLFQNIVLDNIYPDERDESTMKELLSYLKEQFIPSLSPTGWALVQAHNNKTWYGSDLISNSYSDLLKNPETYMDVTDESTSEIANWLAKQINKGPKTMREWLNVLATPKGVDYVLDQLTGGLGDVILPLTTPAERWAGLGASLAAKYTFNEDKSSRYTSEAYDIKDKLTALKAADRITDEESEWLNAFTKTMSASSGDDPDYKTVGDYFKDIRAYRNDLSMSYDERAEKMNDAYKHIADMTYDLVRAYKGGGTAQGSYAEKIIPYNIDTVGFTPETYTAAFNEVSKGDKSAKKLALAANTTLTDAQKEYLSQDIVGVRYDGYAKSYKKLADAGVTAEQITKAYNETKDYDTDKAKALSIVASGQDNAALLAVAIAGTSDDKLDSMVKVYQNAVKSGVTAEMYDGIMNSALAISKASGKKGITKDGLISACKKAGYSSMQTLYIKQLYNPRWH